MDGTNLLKNTKTYIGLEINKNLWDKFRSRVYDNGENYAEIFKKLVEDALWNYYQNQKGGNEI